MPLQIDQETLAILSECTLAPACVVMPPRQLDRKLYEKVDKVLRAAGGKWNKKTRSHHFEEDATEIIDQAILTGTIGNAKQELGIFYTPPALAKRAAQHLKLDHSGMSILEPSAGMGALAIAARDEAQADDERCSWANIACFDIVQRHVAALQELGFAATCADFMKVEAEPGFDRIIMNPPFAKQQDAAHFLHAWGFLKPGGRIVAIMSAAVMFRQTPLYQHVRQMIEGCGEIVPLPAGSFKESGTGVNAVLVIYDKPL